MEGARPKPDRRRSEGRRSVTGLAYGAAQRGRPTELSTASQYTGALVRSHLPNRKEVVALMIRTEVGSGFNPWID